MLPPMLYRVYNPSLGLIEAEGAYLMMCKEVLPRGVMGLMIGGMIFATTSAMNSKLNIASGVITNDIFKRLKPNSSDKRLMLAARISTVVFGVLSILIALLIPKMGGVVNVVISLAALTGVPLYLPVIWTLFSKRQTAFSVLTATILGLIVNGIFKFITPLFFDLSLNRTEEMLLGVTFPILCMTVFEIWYITKKRISSQFDTYKRWENENQEKRDKISEEEIQFSRSENKYSMRVIGYGVSFIGLTIAVLGLLTPAYKIFVTGTGVFFILMGIILMRSSSTGS